jgi:hypothetical protein
VSPQDHALYCRLADEIDELEGEKARVQELIDKLRKQRRELLRKKMTEDGER